MAKIMIVEDNQEYRKSLKNALSEYEIVGEAKDGVTAFELIKHTNPELLILDLSLPRMNGLNLLKKIRPLYPALKIIILTIYASTDYFIECVNTGIDAYVLKDESRKKLLEIIQMVLAGEKYFSPGVDDTNRRHPRI